jgi:hypothetical protein
VFKKYLFLGDPGIALCQKYHFVRFWHRKIPFFDGDCSESFKKARKNEEAKTQNALL